MKLPYTLPSTLSTSPTQLHSTNSNPGQPQRKKRPTHLPHIRKHTRTQINLQRINPNRPLHNPLPQPDALLPPRNRNNLLHRQPHQPLHTPRRQPHPARIQPRHRTDRAQTRTAHQPPPPPRRHVARERAHRLPASSAQRHELPRDRVFARGREGGVAERADRQPVRVVLDDGARGGLGGAGERDAAGRRGEEEGGAEGAVDVEAVLGEEERGVGGVRAGGRREGRYGGMLGVFLVVSTVSS